MTNTVPYFGNIEELTLKNKNFRQVLYTAPHCQLVLMSLEPGEEIGLETHAKVDQFFRFESGTGKAFIDGKEYAIVNGTAIIVPAGLKHNIVNIGKEHLKMYTIYSPAHHIDGRVNATKADALNDKEDEAFGNA